NVFHCLLAVLAKVRERAAECIETEARDVFGGRLADIDAFRQLQRTVCQVSDIESNEDQQGRSQRQGAGTPPPLLELFGKSRTYGRLEIRFSALVHRRCRLCLGRFNRKPNVGPRAGRSKTSGISLWLL